MTLADPQLELADAAERRIAVDAATSCIVEAPAGSGKTGLLIQRYLKLLATVEHPSQVLALTFTRKATGDMRKRILEALQGAENSAPTGDQAFALETRRLAEAVLAQDRSLAWDLLQRPHLLNIRTFDALCSTIARSAPLLSSGAALSDPADHAEPLYRRAAHAVMLRLGEDDEKLTHALTTLLRHRDGDLQTCEQVLAEMLATREQWGRLIPLGAELEDVVLEMSVLPRLNDSLKRAQCAMLKRLHDCFPAAVLERLASLAQQFASAPAYKEHANIFRPCAQSSAGPGHTAQDLDHWLLLMELLLKKDDDWRKRLWDVDLKVSASTQQRAELQDVLQALTNDPRATELLSLLRAVRALPPAEYPADQWIVAKALFRLLQEALIELRLLFTRENVCDFTEVALAAQTALHTTGLQVALGSRLQHLLVDEMQDSSSWQYELLKTLTEGWDGSTQTIFLVGDPKQSIYLFRQARVERFQQCMESGKLGDVALRAVRLSANFRSGQPLVEACNAVFQKIFPASSPLDGDVTFTPAHAAQQGSSRDCIAWHGRLLVPDSEPASRIRQQHMAMKKEAWHIAELIRGERQVRPTASIAVLVRARNHAAEVVKTLTEHNIAFRAVDMVALHERREVLDILAITRALLHPVDRTAWLAVMRAPWCGTGVADLHVLAGGDRRDLRNEPLRHLMRQHANALGEAARNRVLHTLDVMDAALLHTGVESLANRVERTWRSLGGDACTDANGLQNVRQFLAVLDTMAARNETVTQHTLQYRLRRLFAAPASVPGAVDIMTIHKAKGLEWDVVLLPGLHRGGGRDGQVALNWLEMPGEAEDHSQDVLLAPLPEKGETAGSLYSYISGVRRRREQAELKRLVYVAATRARHTLHLFASPVADSKGLPSMPAGTLLHAMAPVASQFRFDAHESALDDTQPEDPPALSIAAASEAEQRKPDRPQLERLLANYDPLERLSRHSLALTLPTPLPPVTTRPQGTFGARAVGNAIHAFVERLAGEVQTAALAGQATDAAALQLLAKLPTWSPAVRAILRSGGLAPSESLRATKTVMRALSNLLNTAEGRWILSPHLAAESEGAWRTMEDTGVRRIRLDRSFFAGPLPQAPGDSTLWIVDFKTSDREPLLQEAFLQKDVELYRAQLEGYGRLRLRALPPGTPVRLALVYPLMQQLVFWSFEEGVSGSVTRVVMAALRAPVSRDTLRLDSTWFAD